MKGIVFFKPTTNVRFFTLILHLKTPLPQSCILYLLLVQTWSSTVISEDRTFSVVHFSENEIPETNHFKVKLTFIPESLKKLSRSKNTKTETTHIN